MMMRIYTVFSIFLPLAVSCSWSTFPPYEPSNNLPKESLRVSTRNPHTWPESIDRDRDGNLYFSDSIEKALYRLVRQPQTSRTVFCEEKLLEGLDHISGVSIDRDKGDLYLGAKIPNEGHCILRLSLSLWERCSAGPIGIQELIGHLDVGLLASRITARGLGKTNGVVFDPRKNTIYYTVRKMSAFKPGHVGKINLETSCDAIQSRDMKSPNGIDIDPQTSQPVVSMSGSLFRYEGGVIFLTPTRLKKTGAALGVGRTALGLPRDNPDGLICLGKTGDVLAAGFRSGKILFLRRDYKTNGFQGAVHLPIDPNLGNPTDMVIGPSSVGTGWSLYVTTTNVWRVFFPKHARGGRVIEIPHIEKRLDDLRK